ncbi:DcaP family trimeric outer membrane transporter, partial [Acinetobacter baretiae]|uniref:DcaP family trimeric outer membrane transporter n=1 Tax=Acinetobacter baretiae TaxID=2605383 RepID=UPI001F3C72A7
VKTVTNFFCLRVEKSVVKVNKLALSIGAALVMGAVGSTQAATTTTHTQKKVVELESQVAQLQQLVQQLSAQQQQQVAQQQQIAQQQQEQSVQLQQNAILALEKPNLAPKESSSKPGWMTLADGKTQLKLYGRVRAEVTYDLDNTNSSTNDIYNRTNKVPLNSDNTTKQVMNATAANSRLGLDLLRSTDYGDLKAKFEGDFMSSSYTNGAGGFRIRHAYVELGKWTVGQTNSPFVTDTPNIVDANGIMGSASLRPVQVRYTQPITKNQKLLVAIEGTTGKDTESNTLTQTQGGSRLPTLSFQYAVNTPDKKGSLKAVGFLHENRVSTNNNNDIEKLAWGVGVGGKYDLTKNDTLFANYYHIVGDNRYMIYPNDAAYSVTSSGGNPQRINQTEMDAVFAGYTHKWNAQFRSSVLGGAIWNSKDSDYSKVASNFNSNAYNKSMYNVLVNTFFTPVKDFELGAEYTYGQRKTFTNKEGDYSRINFVAQYNF